MRRPVYVLAGAAALALALVFGVTSGARAQRVRGNRPIR